ncbi:hypothetical protein AB0O95_07020 [Rhodoglobus sp. NPDC076762]
MGLLGRLFGLEKKRENEVGEEPTSPDFDVERRRAQAVGSFRGKHFTEWAPEVDRLRSEGKLVESLALAYECIEATERQAAVEKHGVAPGYYHDAAVALRKLKRYVEEVQVLERYLARSGRHPGFEDRLRKATALRDAEANASAIACPTCGEVLENPPKSRGKCPSCGQQIVMRTVEDQRVAFTPEQATAYTASDKAAKQRAKFLKRLGYFDVTEKDWDRVHAEQAARFGHAPSDGDVYWQVANERAVGFEVKQDWSLAGRLRSDMAKFSVEEGRDWVGPARAAEENWLRALQQYDGPESEMILIACPCEVCQRDHQQVRSLAQFSASWPLPHVECGRPPCRCRVTRRMY